jgi:DNA segregation ATPase FtsK/SpoIIIE, S-DNA-T family
MRHSNDSFQVGPLLSMYDPIYVGRDETGRAIYIPLAYRNLLAAGVPGSGKSVFVNGLVAHAAMSIDTRLVLLDGKKVELGPWKDIADEFVAKNIDHALRVLRRLQLVLDNRIDYLDALGRKKITRSDHLEVILVVIDEFAYYSSTIGTPDQQREFMTLMRDLVARGRAVGIIIVAATQRPSGADNPPIITASLRDLFAYRAAFRCTTPSSSDLILGTGWAAEGYDARTINDSDEGVYYLLAEDSTPIKVKAPWYSDDDIRHLAHYAKQIRRESGLITTGERVAA